MVKKDEMREFLEGAIDRILISKTKENYDRKINEETQAEKKKAETAEYLKKKKEALYKILSEINWGEMTRTNMKALMRKMVAWGNTEEKKTNKKTNK